MKNLIIFILLVFTATTSFAITVPPKHSSTSAEATITTFAITGTINRFDRNKSLIVISGKRYILDGKGRLKNSDLKAGVRVYYNTEKSSNDKIARVTKIWINSK